MICFYNPRCICGLLKQKMVILVINQLHFFDKLDWILALNSVWPAISCWVWCDVSSSTQGKIVSLSTPEELYNKGIEYHMLLGAKEGVLLDEEEEEEGGGESTSTFYSQAIAP